MTQKEFFSLVKGTVRDYVNEHLVVLVYKCGQEKLNNLYYQVKSKGDV